MNLLLILQDAATEVAMTPLKDEVSLLELMQKGGLTMAILGVLSLISLYLFIDRLIVIRRAKKDPSKLLDKVRLTVMKGDVETAKKYCEKEGTPMAKMVRTGLSHIGKEIDQIKGSVENVGRIELFKLEKTVGWLGMISGAAPMLGFFGTVIGMIKAFIAISQEEGSVSPKLLSSGIYEAMVTTAGGLFVGIMAYVFYNYLVRQIEDVVHRMEVTSIEFIDMLQQPN